MSNEITVVTTDENWTADPYGSEYWNSKYYILDNVKNVAQECETAAHNLPGTFLELNCLDDIITHEHVGHVYINPKHVVSIKRLTGPLKRAAEVERIN